MQRRVCGCRLKSYDRTCTLGMCVVNAGVNPRAFSSIKGSLLFLFVMDAFGSNLREETLSMT